MKKFFVTGKIKLSRRRTQIWSHKNKQKADLLRLWGAEHDKGIEKSPCDLVRWEIFLLVLIKFLATRYFFTA